MKWKSFRQVYFNVWGMGKKQAPAFLSAGALSSFLRLILLLLVEGHALRLVAAAGRGAGNVHMPGVADAACIVSAVYCLASDVGFDGRTAHGASHSIPFPLLKALAAGILTGSGVLAAHLDTASAAVHRIVKNTVLCGTN